MWEHMGKGRNGGGSGIRTHGTLTRTPVFKTGALNHSAIPPGTGQIIRYAVWDGYVGLRCLYKVEPRVGLQYLWYTHRSISLLIGF